MKSDDLVKRKSPFEKEMVNERRMKSNRSVIAVKAPTSAVTMSNSLSLASLWMEVSDSCL
mgnify:CR=1 FL=1